MFIYYIVQPHISFSVLLKEDSQDHIIQWYQNAINSARTNLQLDTIYIDISDEDEAFDKICAGLADGGTIILDITCSPGETARSLSMDVGIPYIKVDVSISPFLLFLDKYLDFRNSTDVSLIFDNPKYIDEALYYWIDTTRLRMLMSETLDKVTAKKTKRHPTITKQFCCSGYNEKYEQPFSNYMSICCNMLNMEDDCQCPEKFNLQEELLSLSVSIMVGGIDQLVKDGFNLTNNLKCNGTTYNEQSRRRLEQILDAAVNSQKQFFRENSEFRIKLTGSIEIGTNESTEIVAKYMDNNIQLVKSLKPIRQFYRVGVTHVSFRPYYILNESSVAKALPWSYKEQDPVTGQWYWTGYCVDFMKRIAQIMDFDFEFVEPKSGTFGRKVDGVWNGVVGDLASGVSKHYIIIKFSLKESFWFALTSFTPQGGGEAPKALSGRTLVAAYWLFVVLMLATFTANLAAFLTVERMQAPVQSLEQLGRQSRINYTVVKGSITHQYFINMKYAEDRLYKMWKELTLNTSSDDNRFQVWDYPIREQYGHMLLAINDSNPVASAEEGFRNVNEYLDADYAFIHDSSEIKYEISRNCNLTEVGDVFGEKPYAIAVQQGSHLQDDLSRTMLGLQKERFFEGLRDKYWNHSAKGVCPSTDDNEGITLESLGGVFIATLFGLALAMITLVGEVFYYRRKRRNDVSKLKTSQVYPEKLAGPPIPKLIDAPIYPVTIGTTFKPVNLKDKLQQERDELKLSHISLYPRARNRITQVDN
ncbi:hypothetical protein NQ314_004028 [Rhamnusium bicolor]|uniref:Uncharacterized protein n=1 Tax=Rhamnusium bicolor TaxID=1586634 RepID=A0AAV8ZKV2_9CUCU|nr:hypothetical protein NQ314_004028 [Rhamnusium bicolor]